MSAKLVKTANFGTGKGALATVGYRLFRSDGSLSGSRITAGIGEVLSGAGIYSSSIYFSDNFSGSILWDTGELSPTYASEDYSPSIDNLSKTVNLISGSVDFTKNHSAGRWKLVEEDYQMIFYKEDNVTELARYDLFDGSGSPSVSAVFERRLNTGSL